MKFFKAHALGNDFILIKTPNLESLTLDFILKINNRLTGIGADQVLAVDPDNNVKIWTEDGAFLTLCGNGLRCLGKLFNEPTITFNTDSGLVELKNLSDNSVSMKVFKTPSIQKFPDHYIVDVGNLHKVFLVDNVDTINVVEYVNDDYIVSFLSQLNNKWMIRTMENHTTKETLACGSAALASAYTLNHLGHHDLTVNFKYGAISHKIEASDIIQIGPATIVAEIIFDPVFIH